MSEQELNSYRFLSGEDPTDDQLDAIMKAALADVRKRATEARIKYDEQYERLYTIEHSKVAQRIENARNGIF
jgi:hypothetical protein